ncbi:bacterial Ig-like domain-containing protein [Lactonifactor longoviformis]|uniref:M6 family metalloprotease domain-containing protein n=2 Tax=Lactonifactor TaxID=420345 RepID=A0A1M4ZIQ0_9CLOT|nr:bacterial Ig-like domain-containing protein [Lactonifactor longoviformis]SHF17913.1 M6 family metalloprotease domain-containing protein [Lactonifactor longoviformis DSM 17459]
MKKKTKTAVCLLILTLLSGSLLSPVCTSAASRKEEVREFANLVVFVQFEPLTEKNFVKDKAEEIFKLWEDPGYGTSLSSYLTEISYGKFQVHNIFPQYDGGSFTPYVIPPESSSDEYSLVDYVINQIQTSEALDYDGDGTVDNLVIVADKPFSDDRGNPFYSHKANYDGSGTIGGKEVFSYNMLNGYSVFEDSISREGVICHEFLHSIGFPDLYRDSASDDSPVGTWDLMASSSIYLQYPLAYLRQSVAGWTQIDTITESAQGLILDTQTNAEGTHAYILKSPLSSNEFFVVEYRKKPVYDFSSKPLDIKIPGSGLIIYRVNTKVAGLTNFASRDDGVYIFRPGVTDEQYCSKDLSQSFLSAAPEINRTSFGSADFTRTIADNTPEESIISFSDGSNSGIVIKNVSAGGGESITFDVEFGDPGELELWDTCGMDTDFAFTSQLSAAIHSSDDIYAVHDDEETVYLSHWDNSSWSKAAPGLQAAAAGSERLLFYRDIPCILYTSQRDGSSTLFAAMFINGSWETIPLASNVYNRDYQAAAAGDSLYISYTDTLEETPDLKLIRFQPESREVISVSLGERYNPSIQAEGDTAYLAARSFPDNQISVYKIAGDTSIEELPAPEAASSIFAVSPGEEGSVYLCAAIDGGDGQTLQAYRFSEGNWYAAGDFAMTARGIVCDLTVAGGIPYAAVMQASSGESCKVSVYRYKDAVWEPFGGAVDRSVDTASYPEVALHTDNEYIYIAYTNYPGAFLKKKKLEESSGTDVPDPTENPVVRITCIPPAKRQYETGEQLDTSGMAVQAVLADNTVMALNDSQYRISGFDSSRTGSQTIKVSYSENIYCYFTVSIAEKTVVPPPAKKEGWVQNSEGWRYLYADGTYPISRWALIEDRWYYFNNRGCRQTGWLKLGNTWYYLKESGAMATGWLKLGNTWYYLKESGAMATGWLKLGNTWYYLKESGAMATGWLKLGNTWYYLKGSGAMATGWLKLGNTWYYLKGSGAMATGWLKLGNTWYYLKGSGAMAAGWLKLGSTWYYLKESGAMATGWLQIGKSRYYFNAGGAWIPR